MNAGGFDHVRSLPELIEAQLACTGNLLGILDRERSALLVNDIDSLESSCTAKAVAVQQLHRLGERTKAAVGAGPATQPIEACLLRQSAGAAMLPRWRELVRLTGLCESANRYNGALLDVRAAQARSALAVLQPDRPTVYGRSGSSRAALAGRMYTQA